MGRRTEGLNNCDCEIRKIKTEGGITLKSRMSRNSGVLFSNYFFVLIAFVCHISLVNCFGFSQADNLISDTLKDDRPCNSLLDFDDAHLSTPEVIEKYGYPLERHWVTTEDGYILEMHRIPRTSAANKTELNTEHSFNETISNENQTDSNAESSGPRPAVFLLHGILSTSRDFVINCERRAIAFQLWENGYDVWMGNYRGNKYSRNHTSLQSDKLEFWNFAIDEVGSYDGPAMIDYILNTTNLKQVSFVAHSMGNGVGLIMLTTRPEFNDKINIWFVMSAAVTLQDTASPPLKILAAFPRTTEWLLTRFNHGELFPPTLLKFLHRYFPFVCRREGRKIGSYHGFCSTLNFFIDGYDPGQVSPKFYSVMAGELPSSTSVKFLVQWMQWIISGDFAMYDFGPLKNLRKYGSVKPKKYLIENLTTPTVIMYGENDWIVSASDVRKTEKITRRLKPVSDPIEYFKVESPSWNHLGFIYGKDADKYIYSHILKRLQIVYQSENKNSTNEQKLQ